MPESIIVPPEAARTIEGLRDTGYESTDALEDIVDNSIAAGAEKIIVRVYMTANGPLVTVADDGTGMDEQGLLNAMTYGSKVSEDPASLGKFGLGLKTASTALCRNLTVVTRDGPDSQVFAATWDLDVVAEQNDWILQRPEPTDEQVAILDEAAHGESGTVVIWTKVDRLIKEYQDTQSRFAKKALANRVEEFNESLSVTYLKYLNGEWHDKRIEITLNDELIKPWDPFGRDIGGEALLVRKIPVDIIDRTGVHHQAEIALTAYSLPPRSELSKQQEAEARISPKNQGFYIFREGRLLARGLWLGLRIVDPHLNLARIDFSFDHRLDEAFQIDIKKSRINLQQDLVDSLRTLLNPSIAEAENRYRKNQTTQAVIESGDLHASSNKIIEKNKNKVLTATVTVDPNGNGVVKNSKGTMQFTMKLDDTATGPHVTVRDSIEDGQLWEPTIIDQEQAVALNAGHPFYQRVYLPNSENGTAIQGINFLLWGLCAAEWAVMSPEEKEGMVAIRRLVSRITRQLALELPDQVKAGS